MKFRLVSLFLFLIGLFYVSNACIKKQTQENISYECIRKYLDDNYVKQAELLHLCHNLMPTIIYDKIDCYVTFHLNTALKEIEKILDDDVEIQILRIKKYSDCILMVSKHEVNKFLCKHIFLKPNELDYIEKYMLIEYKECIKGKNRNSENPLIFELPKIGFGSVCLQYR